VIEVNLWVVQVHIT